MSHPQAILFFIGVFLFIVALMINLAVDYNIILTKGRINHKNISHWIRKASICMPSVVLLALATNAKWIWALLFSGLMVAFWFYLLFGLFLNILRGFKWSYTGTPDEWDSGTEKIERNLPTWAVIGFKLLLIIVSTYVYVKLLD